MHDCQVRGCNGIALPWSFRVEVFDYEIEVFLCRRHEVDLLGTGAPREPAREREVEEATT